MSEVDLHKAMISTVAQALGPELLSQVAFVGGCTTALLITDDYTREQVRHTKDVDLIVPAIGHAEWHQLQTQLRKRGFRDIVTADAPICALYLGELRVDFMPHDERILGFSNRWYADALASAEPYQIGGETEIRLVTPPYFVATKLEAYKGRGKQDPLASQDIEDILNLVSGRDTLTQEIAHAPSEVRQYMSEELRCLLTHAAMAHAIEGCAHGQPGMSDLIYQRLDAIIAQQN